MALLNPPEILPPLIRAILEATALNGKPVDEDSMVEMLAPGADENSIGKTAKRHVRHSFVAARTIGLLEKDDKKHVLADDVAALLSRGSLREAWPSLRLQSLLEHDSAPRAVAEAVEGDTTGVRDLLFALTWFLAQDALGPPLPWQAEAGRPDFQSLQQQQFGDVSTRHPVQNDTRFGAFERWSVHLGFAVLDETGNRTLRPLPVPVVQAFVATLASGSYPIDEFCQLLGSAVPCLWPGALRNQLAEIIEGGDPDPDVGGDGVDSSIAAALITLQAMGSIRLDNLADAAQRRVLAPRSMEPRSVTHVQVLP